MELQQRRGFDNDGQSSNTPGIQKEGQESEQGAILDNQVGGPLSGPAMDAQLLP